MRSAKDRLEAEANMLKARIQTDMESLMEIADALGTRVNASDVGVGYIYPTVWYEPHIIRMTKDEALKKIEESKDELSDIELVRLQRAITANRTPDHNGEWLSSEERYYNDNPEGWMSSANSC